MPRTGAPANVLALLTACSRKRRAVTLLLTAFAQIYMCALACDVESRGARQNLGPLKGNCATLLDLTMNMLAYRVHGLQQFLKHARESVCVCVPYLNGAVVLARWGAAHVACVAAARAALHLHAGRPYQEVGRRGIYLAPGNLVDHRPRLTRCRDRLLDWNERSVGVKSDATLGDAFSKRRPRGCRYCFCHSPPSSLPAAAHSSAALYSI